MTEPIARRSWTRPIWLVALLALAVGGAVFGIRWHTRRNEWTYGDPLPLPKANEVTSVEIRKWDKLEWRPLGSDDARRLLEALAQNREAVPPDARTCCIPINVAYEVRLRTTAGPYVVLGLSGSCWQILGSESSSNGSAGFVDDYGDGATWSLDIGTRGTAQRIVKEQFPSDSPDPGQ